MILTILLIILVIFIAIFVAAHHEIRGGLAESDKLKMIKIVKNAKKYADPFNSIDNNEMNNAIDYFIDNHNYIFPEIFAVQSKDHLNIYLEPSQLYYQAIISKTRKYADFSDEYKQLYNIYKPILNMTRDHFKNPLLKTSTIEEVLSNAGYGILCSMEDEEFNSIIRDQFPMIWIYKTLLANADNTLSDEIYEYIRNLYNPILNRIKKIPEARYIMLLRDVYSNYSTRGYIYVRMPVSLSKNYAILFISILFYHLVQNIPDNDLFFDDNVDITDFGINGSYHNSMHAHIFSSPLVKVMNLRSSGDLGYPAVYNYLAEKSILSYKLVEFKQIPGYEAYRQYEIDKLKIELGFLDFYKAYKSRKYECMGSWYPPDIYRTETNTRNLHKSLDMGYLFNYYLYKTWTNYEYATINPQAENILNINATIDEIETYTHYLHAVKFNTKPIDKDYINRGMTLFYDYMCSRNVGKKIDVTKIINCAFNVNKLTNLVIKDTHSFTERLGENYFYEYVDDPLIAANIIYYIIMPITYDETPMFVTYVIPKIIEYIMEKEEDPLKFPNETMFLTKHVTSKLPLKLISTVIQKFYNK